MSKAGLIETFKHTQARTFCFLFLLIGSAVEISRVVRDTFFISTVGAGAIPWAYVTFAGVMVICSSLYARGARRLSLENLLAVTLALALLSLLIEYFLIATGNRTKELAYGIFCSVEMMFLFVPMTIWALANHSFSLQDGESYLPRIATFGLIGTVLGGLLSRILVKQIGAYNLLGLSCTALSIALLLALTRFRRSDPVKTDLEETHSATFRGSLKEPLVKTLVLIALPMWMLVYMVEYTYYHTMEAVFSNETDLAAFLSIFLTISSLVALVVQLWVTPWLTRKFGVARISTVYPGALAVAGLLTFVYALVPLSAHPKDSITPVVCLILLARLLDMALYQSIYDSTVHVLYYAVPTQIRTQARALVAGIVFPVSIACAGLLLVFFNMRQEPVHNIAFCAVAIGFLVIVMAMDIRPDYLRSLLKYTSPDDHLRREELLREISQLEENEARYIVSDALAETAPDERLATIERLREHFPAEFIEELLNPAAFEDAELAGHSNDA